MQETGVNDKASTVKIELPAEPATLRAVAGALERTKAWPSLLEVLDAWLDAEPDNLQLRVRQYEAWRGYGDDERAAACLRLVAEDCVDDRARLSRLLKLFGRAGHSDAVRIMTGEAHRLAPADWRLALDYAALLEPGADRRRVLSGASLQPARTTVARAAMLTRLLSENRRDDAIAVMAVLFDAAVADSSRLSIARNAVLEQMVAAGEADLVDEVLARYARNSPAGLASCLASERTPLFQNAILASLRRIRGDELDPLPFELVMLRMFEAAGRIGDADELFASIEPRITVEDDPVVPSPTASTMMFRNPPLLEALVGTINWFAERRGRVRVHVAACSSGEEAYSLALALQQAGLLECCDLEASDVDPGLVRRARMGVIDAKLAQALPAKMLEQHFERQDDGRFRLASEILERISFSQQDLLSEPVDSARYDVFVANNVLVHFPDKAKIRMLACMAGRVVADGVLCIGGGRQDALEDQIAALGLVPIEARGAVAFDAWRIQRHAWYVNPRPYWALPAARHTATTPWKHAALFARCPETAAALEQVVAGSGAGG